MHLDKWNWTMGRLQHQNLPKLMQEGEKKIGQSFEAFAPLFPFEKSLLVGAVCRWEEDKCGAKKGLQTLQCCHRSDSSSLPQTPSVLPCLVQPSTAGLHWNVVSSPQEDYSCFLLSILLSAPTMICYLLASLSLISLFCQSPTIMKCFENLTLLIHHWIRFLYKQPGAHTGSFTNTSSCPFVAPTLHWNRNTQLCWRLTSLKWLQPKETTDKIHSQAFPIHRHCQLEDCSEDKARVAQGPKLAN